MIYVHKTEFESGKRKSYAKLITKEITSLKDGSFLREGENLVSGSGLIVHVVPTGSAKNGSERLYVISLDNVVLHLVDDWTKSYHSTIAKINELLKEAKGDQC